MNYLKERIEQAGMTVKSLSDATGIAKSHLYSYITEAATPSAQTIDKIATALGCKPVDIFPEQTRKVTRLFRIMRKKGVTQMELSKASELGFVTINRAVNGHASEITLSKIAKTLGVDVSDIREETKMESAGMEYITDDAGNQWQLPCLKEAEQVIRIADAAMSPRYEQGAWLACRRSEVTENAKPMAIEQGGRTLFRRVRLVGNELLCIADNAEFPTLNIPANEVEEAWEPVGYVRREVAE